MLKLSIQCTWFEVMIVVVQVGAVKIYAAALEALRKKERGGQKRMKLILPPKKPKFYEINR
jgi:hypothetical protein